MNPFKRKTKESPYLHLLNKPIHITHSVNHTIEYAPKPRPTRIHFSTTNDEGQRWQMPPVTITGQAILPLYMPLAFLTGRPEDNAKQIKLEGYMEY